MKNLIFKIFYFFGLTIEKAVDKRLVLSLIRKLKPYTVEKKLIRLGPKGDGGYLVPDDLDGIEACFSPGVGQLHGFELDCLKLGMKVFLADGSVDSPGIEGLDFIKKFIGPVNLDKFITLDSWVNFKYHDNQDLMLQMDIESHEYLTIISMPKSLIQQFRIMIVEFHDLHKLGNSQFYKTISAAVDKLLMYHTCVHIHPNNYRKADKRLGIEIPRALELTFLRNDRFSDKFPSMTFPHELDIDSTDNTHLPLPRIWYED